VHGDSEQHIVGRIEGVLDQIRRGRPAPDRAC